MLFCENLGLSHEMEGSMAVLRIAILPSETAILNFHLHVCSSSAPCKYEKICVNFHGLKQEQRCVLCFEMCIVIWKSYLAELLFLSHFSSGFSGSFTAMRRKDIRVLGHIKCACLLWRASDHASGI